MFISDASWFEVGFEGGEGVRDRGVSHTGMILSLLVTAPTAVSPLGTERFAIFCLFRMGAEVFDTDMMIVDQTITDICFENVTIL